MTVSRGHKSDLIELTETGFMMICHVCVSFSQETACYTLGRCCSHKVCKRIHVHVQTSLGLEPHGPDNYILVFIAPAYCQSVTSVYVVLERFKGIYLSKALTCMEFSCINKNCVFVKETDTFGHIVV